MCLVCMSVGVGTAEYNVQVSKLFHKNNYDNMKHILRPQHLNRCGLNIAV